MTSIAMVQRAVAMSRTQTVDLALLVNSPVGRFHKQDERLTMQDGDVPQTSNQQKEEVDHTAALGASEKSDGVREILDDYEQMQGYTHGGSLAERLRFALSDHRMRVKSTFRRRHGVGAAGDSDTIRLMSTTDQTEPT